MNYFSDYSLWWLLLIVIASCVLSYFYYFRTEQRKVWNTKQIRLLSLLRTATLVLVGLLLLGLVWETLSYRREKPLVITLVDHSQSMKNYKDSSKVESLIASFSTELKQELGDGYDYSQLAIGSHVRNTDSLVLKDQTTDLSEGFKHIKDLYFNRNIGAIVLVSDGNYNKGVHPMYEAERIELTPVFTLAVGDTLEKRDIVVRSVQSNEVAFVNNEFPVQALIDFNRVPAANYQVKLSQNGKVIQTQLVKVGGAGFEQKELFFTIQAKEKGFQRLTISVDPVAGEVTTSNNAASCFVEVIDSKSTIVLLSSAPHPDIAALRSVFELDKEAKIESKLLSEFQLGTKTPDFVVWYENGLRPNAVLFKQIFDKGIPVLLILGPNVSTSLLQNYGLAMKAPNGNQMEDVYPHLNPGFSTFGLSNEFGSVVTSYPPLRTKFGAYQLPANSVVVLSQRIGSVVKDAPLVAVAQTNKAKIGFVLGEGVWRWRMKEFMQHKNTNGFEEFFQKLTQYISIKQNREPLRVILPKKFSSVEELLFKAEFYNDAMELITTPTIELILTKQGEKSIKQQFSSISNFYQLNSGRLEPGIYEWKVVADNKGKKYQKSGSFVVEEISLEAQESKANYAVLNQLSAQSDGALFPLSKYKQLIETLKKRTDIATVQYEDTGYQKLIDWKWLFLFIMLTVGGEWFLRRWWGSY